MSAETIIRQLFTYGHLPGVEEHDLPLLTLGHSIVREGARSYQQFMAHDFQRLVAKHHGRMPHYDGEIGPATAELFTVERCAVPDFLRAEEATGGGSWPAGCNPKWPNNHVITVSWDKSRVPSFVAPHFETIWANVVAAYAEIGLLMIREDGNTNANIQASYTSLGGSTIGLAIVGQGQRCNTSIWANFDIDWHPANIIREQTTLWKHEFGHNKGLGHSQGGVMNPSIVAGLPVSWIGDVSEPILNRMFGGDPVPTDPTGQEMWVQQCLKSDRGRELCLPLNPPRPVGA